LPTQEQKLQLLFEELAFPVFTDLGSQKNSSLFLHPSTLLEALGDGSRVKMLACDPSTQGLHGVKPGADRSLKVIRRGLRSGGPNGLRKKEAVEAKPEFQRLRETVRRLGISEGALEDDDDDEVVLEEDHAPRVASDNGVDDEVRPEGWDGVGNDYRQRGAVLRGVMVQLLKWAVNPVRKNWRKGVRKLRRFETLHLASRLLMDSYSREDLTGMLGIEEAVAGRTVREIERAKRKGKDVDAEKFVLSNDIFSSLCFVACMIGSVAILEMIIPPGNSC
jgi:hypothetical protein